MDFLDKYKKRQLEPIEDILTTEVLDRRLLPHVPSPDGQRSPWDRRGTASPKDREGRKFKEQIDLNRLGQRYMASFPVKVTKKEEKTESAYTLLCENISGTGILLAAADARQAEAFEVGTSVHLKFDIPKGAMPEGFEGKISVDAKIVRTLQQKDGRYAVGLAFSEDLASYMKKRKDRRAFVISAGLLAMVSFFVVMMRAESVIYFRFNRVLYLYSLIAACFLLTRYLFGALYRPVPIDPDYTPGVTVIIPCFNEEEWIQRTIISCMDQNYPPEKLEVIVVDDCSTDRSVEKISEIVSRLQEDDRLGVKGRLSYFVQPQNAGKRSALVRGAECAVHELVVFVDSDSFLDPYAIRNLVQPFKDPKMGGVAGRTDVANTYTNGLTKMQSVRYYIAFRIMKAAEGLFDCVTCLSGPLSCYRKEIVLKHKEDWLNQKFFGQKATFGDDRAMTNFVLKEYRTSYQDTAVCSTIVPNRHGVFLKQQMRWKRSWLRESLMAGEFIWRKEPFASVNFYIGLLVPILAPAVVVYNLFYVPIVQHIFPKTFLVGLLLMAFMMSFAQMFLRKSTTWIYGLVFCLYYEVVLLWQMPIAWFTFWKSTWGTRMTPSDVKAQEKKEERKRKRKERKEGNHESI